MRNDELKTPRVARRSNTAAHFLFFPAAAFYAAFILPLSVYSLTSGTNWLSGLARSTGHGHEMLFGFALAVVAGFLINRTTPLKLWLLFGFWLSARISYLLAPAVAVSHICNILFALWLAYLAAPQFAGAAKKWRNQAFAPVVVGLALAAVSFHIFSYWHQPLLQPAVLRSTIVLLALLLGFMGGRVIVPAVAGFLQTRGEKLEPRVQPRLEAAYLLVMFAALVAGLLPKLQWLAGLCLVLAGAILLIRLMRWRLWRCWQRADLLCLSVGYGWLGVGLVLLGTSHWAVGLQPTNALHAITVGALGTLTTTVMARTRVVKTHHHPEQLGSLYGCGALLSAAALLRLFAPYSVSLLLVAAALWSLAFLILFALLMRFSHTRPR